MLLEKTEGTNTTVFTQICQSRIKITLTKLNNGQRYKPQMLQTIFFLNSFQLHQVRKHRPWKIILHLLERLVYLNPMISNVQQFIPKNVFGNRLHFLNEWQVYGKLLHEHV